MPSYIVVAAKKCENFDGSAEKIIQSFTEMFENQSPFLRVAASSPEIESVWVDFEEQFNNLFVISILSDKDLLDVASKLSKMCSKSTDRAYLMIGSPSGLPNDSEISMSYVAADSLSGAMHLCATENPDIKYFGCMSREQIIFDLQKINELNNSISSKRQ